MVHINLQFCQKQFCMLNPSLTKGGVVATPPLDIRPGNTYTHRFWAKWLYVIVNWSFALISAKFERNRWGYGGRALRQSRRVRGGWWSPAYTLLC